MANLGQLPNLTEDPQLRRKVQGAIMVAIDAFNVSGTAQQKAWAMEAAQNVGSEARRVLSVVLGNSVGMPVPAIKDMDDTQVQNKVDAAIALFIV